MDGWLGGEKLKVCRNATRSKARDARQPSCLGICIYVCTKKKYLINWKEKNSIAKHNCPIN